MVGEAQVIRGYASYGSVIGPHPDVEPAVVVVVEEPGREAAALGLRETQRGSDVREAQAAVVAVEPVFSDVGNVDVQIPVVVVVAEGHTLGEAVVRDPRLCGDLRESSVSVVPEELGRIVDGLVHGGLVAAVEVQVAVVVEVSPGARLTRRGRAGQSRLPGDVRECAVAVVPQQRFADLAVSLVQPRSAQHQQIHVPVVVVVRVDEVQPAQLVLQARAGSHVLEASRAEVAVAVACDRAVMHENVWAAVVLGDEAEALLAVEPLHGSGGHALFPPSMPGRA